MPASLGLDLSTVKTGFCVGGVGDHAPRGGVWKLPGAGPEVLGRTCGLIAASIIEWHKVMHFEHVAIEANFMPSDGKTNAATIQGLAQIMGAARAAVHRVGAIEHLVASSTVRKYFIGSGRVPSAEAKTRTVGRCELLGWSVVDDNHADACATWAWCMANFFPKWTLQATPLFSTAAGGDRSSGGALAGGQK